MVSPTIAASMVERRFDRGGGPGWPRAKIDLVSVAMAGISTLCLTSRGGSKLALYQARARARATIKMAERDVQTVDPLNTVAPSKVGAKWRSEITTFTGLAPSFDRATASGGRSIFMSSSASEAKIRFDQSLATIAKF